MKYKLYIVYSMAWLSVYTFLVEDEDVVGLKCGENHTFPTHTFGHHIFPPQLKIFEVFFYFIFPSN